MGFEGIDDGGRSQSLYKGMSRVAVKKDVSKKNIKKDLVERKERGRRGETDGPAVAPLRVPCTTVPIVDACAHLHLAAAAAAVRSGATAGNIRNGERAQGGRVPSLAAMWLAAMWRAAEPATLTPPLDAILHAVCDVKSLDPAYGAASYRSWEHLGDDLTVPRDPRCDPTDQCSTVKDPAGHPVRGSGDAATAAGAFTTAQNTMGPEYVSPREAEPGGTAAGPQLRLWMAFGIDPAQAAGVNPDALIPRLARYVRETRAVAVGVAGLDYSPDPLSEALDEDARAVQRETLARLLALARGEVPCDDDVERRVEDGREKFGASCGDRGEVSRGCSEGRSGGGYSGELLGGEETDRAGEDAKGIKSVGGRERGWGEQRITLPVIISCAGGPAAEADLMRLLMEHAQAVAAVAGREERASSSRHVRMMFLNPSPSLMLAALQAFPGALIAFSGAVTFAKSKQIHEAAFDCPMDRIALASEAPGHVPSQMAGRGAVTRGHGGHGGGRGLEWSHPGTLAFTAQRIADIKGRGCTADDVIAAAARNVRIMLGDPGA